MSRPKKGKFQNFPRLTRQERARPLRNFGNLSNNINKPTTPQAPFSNTQGNQATIKRMGNPKQSFNSGFRNGLGYTQPRVYNKPILPTPNMRPSTSYNQRPSFHNNQRRNSYNSQKFSQYQRNNYQRRYNSYSNQTFFRPQDRPSYRTSYQNQNSFQNNPWSAFSNFGIEKLCMFLQDPRMFDLGSLKANQYGPKKQWVPKA